MTSNWSRLLILTCASINFSPSRCWVIGKFRVVWGKKKGRIGPAILRGCLSFHSG